MRLDRLARLVALFVLLAAPAVGQPAATTTTAKPPSVTPPVTPSTARAPTAQSAQQARMKVCNAEAGEKKLSGNERKRFMADCLAGRPASATTAAPSAPAKPAATATEAGLIDINSASKEQLDALPQIGSARAEAIIKGRPYKTKSDLVARKIIPANAYKAIQRKIVARQTS